MTSKKVYFIMIGVMALLSLLIIGATVAGNMLLQKKSSKLVSLKIDNQVIDAQQTSLALAKQDIKKYGDKNDIAKQIVPQDKDQAQAAREIVSLADAAGVKLSAISFPASNLGQAAPKSSSSQGSSSSTTTNPSITQVKPVDGIKNVFQLDITVVSDSNSPTTYSKFIDFLSRLENNRRTAQVTQITIQPDSKIRSAVNFTLVIRMYIKP